MNTLIKRIRQHWPEKIFYFVLASPALFLLVNKYPYFLVLSIIIVIFLGLIFFLNSRKITSYHYPVLLVLTLIYIYFIISYFFSGQYLSNFFSYNFLRKDGNFFFCYILFFALAIPFFDYKKVTNYYFKFLFFVFSVFSAIGIIEFLIGYSVLMIGEDTTAGKMFMGLNIAHNATGSVYALVSIFALIFFLEEKVKKVKILYSIVFLLCTAGLFLSKSRGSYLAFFGAAIFVLWMHFKSIKKFFLTLSVLIVIFIPVLWVTHAFERFIQIFQTEGTAAVRLELWKKAWNLFSKSPVFGVGFGRFNDIRSVLYENLVGREGVLAVFLHPRFYFDFSHAHNSYLQFLAETGVIGLGLLLFFWCLCFQTIFKALKLAKDNYSKKVFLAGLASIVVLFILSFTENYFSATTIMVCASMIVSLCIGLAWQESRLGDKNC